MQIDLRRKWRRLAAFGAIWVFVLFPIPFLPLWGFDVSPQAVQALIIITAIVSIPLTALFIFMK